MNHEDIKAIFRLIAKNMSENKNWLIELDGAIGDGDLGLTMSTGFAKAAEVLERLEDKDIGNLLKKAGMVIGESAPSTMGTLIATGFMRGGTVVHGKEDLDLDAFTKMMRAFTEGIMSRGKARPGDKTILDSLFPAVEALNRAVENNGTFSQGLKLAYKAAFQGAEKTKELVSKHGRAAYYREKSIGKQDAGAVVGMLLFKSLADYVN